MTIDIEGWWIDSGATRHVAKTKEGLIDFKEVAKGEHKIYMENNTYLDVEGIVEYKLDLGDSFMILKNVLFASGIRRNLISVPVFLQKDFEVRFYSGCVTIGKNTKVYATEKYVPGHDLFCLNVIKSDEIKDSSQYTLCYMSDYDLWHERLGHPGNSKMEQVKKMSLVSNIFGARRK